MRASGVPTGSRTGRPGGAAVAEAEGLVVRTESGFYRVLSGDRVIVCRAPKRLLQGERVNTAVVVIGDRVRFREMKHGTGIIEDVLPRENELVRGAARGSRYLDIIAANLDQLVVVHSIRAPEMNPARVDRFLLIAEAAEIPVLLCLNKIDLAEPGDLAVAAVYRAAGYQVLLTSAKTGQGIEELKAALHDRTSALVGPSGVGKSSLLNAIQPGLRLRTAEISESTGKGRHTTTTAELLPLREGGWVADTPGLRELTIREVEPEDLAWLFPEFRPYLVECRFSNCAHRQEVDCAVRTAVAAGAIAADRYASYLRVYDHLVEQQPF